MRPTADHRPFAATMARRLFAPGTVKEPLAPNRLRWDPPADLPHGKDFVDGMVTMLANRDPADLEGVAVHLYRASKSMERRVFVDADGELLIIPQSGTLHIATELGRLDVAPGSIGVIPRGIKFRVEVDGEARGYVAENHGLPLRLPDLGPIGVNGLANPRDFETPVAWFEDKDEPTEVIQKSLGSLVDDDARSFAARRRRVARQLRALSLRPVALQRDRHDQLRPSRPVDLHGADIAQQCAGPSQCRLRHLPAALDGGRGHVPPALVPPQRDERGDGPDPRRL